eukprot:4454380-Alexandrium_andersonii.AAC.1
MDPGALQARRALRLVLRRGRRRRCLEQPRGEVPILSRVRLGGRLGRALVQVLRRGLRIVGAPGRV